MIKIKRTDKTIAVSAQYSPDLPAKVRGISGKWDRESNCWIFPAAAAPQVKEIYLEVYGEWDDTPTDTVNLRCSCLAGEEITADSLTLGGRVIARAFGRDSGAKTLPGVIIISGGFVSGGSVKNWKTICKKNTIFRLLDVPIKKAVELADSPDWCDSIEIEKKEGEGTDRDNLIAERVKLTARISEIDAILHQT